MRFRIAAHHKVLSDMVYEDAYPDMGWASNPGMCTALIRMCVEFWTRAGSALIQDDRCDPCVCDPGRSCRAWSASPSPAVRSVPSASSARRWRLRTCSRPTSRSWWTLSGPTTCQCAPTPSRGNTLCTPHSLSVCLHAHHLAPTPWRGNAQHPTLHTFCLSLCLPVRPPPRIDAVKG